MIVFSNFFEHITLQLALVEPKKMSSFFILLLFLELQINYYTFYLKYQLVMGSAQWKWYYYPLVICVPLIIVFILVRALCACKRNGSTGKERQVKQRRKKEYLSSIYSLQNISRSLNLIAELRKIGQLRVTNLPTKKGQLRLRNIGNTCYMNSALQCLHKSKYFTQQVILKMKSLGDASAQGVGLILLYNELVQNFLKDPEKPQSPVKIKAKVAEKNFLFQHNRQNDAVEFLLTFLSGVSDQMSLAQEKKYMTIDRMKQQINQCQILNLTIRNDNLRARSIVEDVFTGRYRTSYICQECKFDYVLFEQFNVHNIKIPYNHQKILFGAQQYDLVSCLRKFQQQELLQKENKLFCDRCQKDTSNLKTMEVFIANKVLGIRIERFINGRKDQRKVIIPKELKPTEVMPSLEFQIYKNKIYRLYACCLHSGTLQFGHYTAACLDYQTEKWINYNDEHYSSYTAFNSMNLDNVYAVFYELCPLDQ